MEHRELVRVRLGTFYGFDIFVEVPSDMAEKEWSKMFGDWLKGEKQHAVEMAKTSTLLDNK